MSGWGGGGGGGSVVLFFSGHTCKFVVNLLLGENLLPSPALLQGKDIDGTVP